ncbi:penicillin acylase family protein [Archaeoglobus neptunius]|uniref:penicillin acylase family protein n=1 Tax=Archaeoglobus neptunius TaxID=2798580 RepID=UPI001927FE52|nr:penicillin acylase family protein [Archaeoglobus neptunius]
MKFKPVAIFVFLLVFFAIAHSYISLLAPFSGSIWKTTSVKHVNSPYGRATVYYDEYGVPHITADDEKALAFAVGYVQAKDRMFQMDLYRRMMKGELSEVFGEKFFDSDEFHVKMDFISSAEASWKLIKKKDPKVAELLEAYSDGVNYCIRTCEPAPEFKLANYRPYNWTPVDTLLISKSIAWGLTGNFWDLKRALIVQKLGEKALELYPPSLKHDYPIIRTNLSKKFVDYVSKFEGTGGSNNWVVSGNKTTTGKPMLANDPHLLLFAPPIWYEMHTQLRGWNVRGVTFPGIPVIVIGWNDNVAWGFTNVGADVIDFYQYVWNGSKYLYKGKWVEPERVVKTVRVKTDHGFEERKVIVEKTVHGPVLEKYGIKVAVSWTGLAATPEAVAIYHYNYARNMSDFIKGLKEFYVPAQNVVYADIYGNTMYYPAGKYPIRTINGKEVPGNIIFNGSNGDGEWKGFKPYGISSWEGFIPFEEIPHLINPDYVATANQRVVFGYRHYLGDSMYFADPYRAMRIYEMLDSADKVDANYFMKMQRDTYSKVAENFVPFILEAKDKMVGLKDYVEKLENWDYRMEKDSEGALIFSLWLKYFVNETFGDEFYSAGLDDSFYPRLYVLQNLPPDSPWYDDKRTEAVENRDDIAARALKMAVKEIKEKGYKTYGDLNVLNIKHAFSGVVNFFDYRRMPMSGSDYTVFNFRRTGWEGTQAGSSWRMIVTFDKNYCVIPGGNSGFFLSKHYSDQLDLWASGEYKVCDFSLRGDVIEFG